MMARKRSRKNHFDEVENHDRWLISYADFITLLFAFFVVMYSISSVNNAKYESFSESLDKAFEETQIIEEPVAESEEKQQDEFFYEKDINLASLNKNIIKGRGVLHLLSKQFEDILQPYIENDLVKVIRKDYWIELEMKNQLLFLSGEAILSSKATPILQKVTDLIKQIPNDINVEGHTDNVDIKTKQFPSNWDLSSARASSVVRALIENGISPQRISSVGFGEYHPIADNNEETGRSQNRRVVLVLKSQAFSRYGIRDEESKETLNQGLLSDEIPDLPIDEVNQEILQEQSLINEIKDILP